MKTISIGKHKLEVYDSIEELPMARYHKFSKMLLIDAGIGSDLQAIDRHVERAIAFMRTNKADMAEQELRNLRQTVFFSQQGISPKSLAYAALIESIDGEPTDISDEGLERTKQVLDQWTLGKFSKASEESKKKIEYELRTYFPSIFDDASIKEYHDQLKRRTIDILDNIVYGASEERDTEIRSLTNYLLTFERPHSFEGKDNIEIAYDKQFERMNVILTSQLHINPKQATVMEYYNAYEYLTEQAKRMKARK